MIDQHLSDLLEWPISLGPFWPKSLGPFCPKSLTKLRPQLLTTTGSLNTPLKRNKSRLNKIVFYYKIHIEDTLVSYSTDFLKFFGRVKGPLKMKFANDFIVYQKFPSGDELCLASYTQSSVRGWLKLYWRIFGSWLMSQTLKAKIFWMIFLGFVNKG